MVFFLTIDARIAERKAKQRLHSFLLRNEFIYHGKTKWIKSHYNCLAQLKMNHPAQQVAFQYYIDAVNECTERITRLDEQIVKAAEEWRRAPTVKALQALRGESLFFLVNAPFKLQITERGSSTTKLCLAVANPRISGAQPSLEGSASVLVMKRLKSLLNDRKWGGLFNLTLSDI